MGIIKWHCTANHIMGQTTMAASMVPQESDLEKDNSSEGQGSSASPWEGQWRVQSLPRQRAPQRALQDMSGGAFWTTWVDTHHLQHSREHYFFKYYIQCGPKAWVEYTQLWHKMPWKFWVNVAPTPWGTARESFRHKKDLSNNCD